MKRKILKKKLVIIKFIRDVYMIDNFKINILIEINILKLKNVIINLFNKNVIFFKYKNIFIFVQIIVRNNIRIYRIMRSEKRQILFSKFINIIQIFLKSKAFLFNQDFLFKSKIQNVYIYLIDTNFNFVFIRNDIDSFFIISRKYKIDSIIKYETKKDYFLNIKNYFLIIKFFKKKKPILKKFINRFFFEIYY